MKKGILKGILVFLALACVYVMGTQGVLAAAAEQISVWTTSLRYDLEITEPTLEEYADGSGIFRANAVCSDSVVGKEVRVAVAFYNGDGKMLECWMASHTLTAQGEITVSGTVPDYATVGVYFFESDTLEPIRPAVLRLLDNQVTDGDTRELLAALETRLTRQEELLAELLQEKDLPINYALPYTQWNWKSGLEESDIQEDSFHIFNTAGTDGVLGHKYTLSKTVFCAGQTLYFGVKAFEKDGGNLTVVFLDGSKELSRVNAVVTSPITYLTTVVPENATEMQVRFHGTSWTAMSAGEFYISTVEFDENTVFAGETDTVNCVVNEIYVSADGDDSNAGTFEAPMRSIAAALEKGNRITLMGGTYPGETIYTADYEYSEIYIRGAEAASVILNYGTNILVNDGSEILVPGYSKVYQVLCEQPYAEGAYSYRIYQDFVPDTATIITDEDRHPLQRGRDYRCDSTAIYQVYNTKAEPFFESLTEALDQIEALPEGSYGFYWYNGTMYFSRPEQSSEEHPIIMPVQDARFIDQNLHRLQRNQCRVVLNNIEVRYGSIHLAYTSNNVCTDVLVKYPYVSVGGGFYIYEASNVELTRCEASSVTNGLSNGDGFNVDTRGDAGSDDAALCCSVILDECWAHDNNDDGYSDHDRSECLIRGGLYEYCGKGGLTPAYGANDVIENAVCRYNRGAGILVTGIPTTGRKATTVIASNCLSYGQTYGFRTDTDGIIHCVNCVAYDNTAGDYAAQTGSIYTYGCKSGSDIAVIGNVVSNAFNDV